MTKLTHIGGILDGQRSEWDGPPGECCSYSEGHAAHFEDFRSGLREWYSTARYLIGDRDVWVLVRNPRDHEFNRRRIVELGL